VLEPSTYGALLRGALVAEDENPAETLEHRLLVAESIRQAFAVDEHHHDQVRWAKHGWTSSRCSAKKEWASSQC
jgi:hypothetical protein